jgi:hypothetical protein
MDAAPAASSRLDICAILQLDAVLPYVFGSRAMRIAETGRFLELKVL